MKTSILFALSAAAFLFTLAPTQADAAPYCKQCFFIALKQCGVTLQTQTPASRACSHKKMNECAADRWAKFVSKCTTLKGPAFGKRNAACRAECMAKKNIKTRKQARACLNACWERHAAECAKPKFKKSCK